MRDLDRAEPLGARPTSGGARVVVWAPVADRVEVLDRDDGVRTTLEPDDAGYHRGDVEGLGPGDRYRYRLHLPDGTTLDRADPASRWQPDGVHGPSAVDDPAGFAWSDDGWTAPPLRDLVVYELHVGAFTPQGDFDAAAGRLPALAELGVTAVEIMPVAEFPGSRNWGYDGVFPYAVQSSYGGPDGLRRFVDAAHAAGVAVLLDVVYNHLGPEGAVLADYGPYYTDEYRTPWGEAVNFDGPGSDAVRWYVVDNAARWIRDFHVDGLRLDAVHAIYDHTATHVLQQIGEAVHREAAALGRRAHVVVESDLNDPRLLRAVDVGGYGLDATWCDDLHHGLHVALTGEQDGYYADYSGVADVATAYERGYVFTGQYSIDRGRTHGVPADDLPPEAFVACVQNHDQVGNRPRGDRLTTLVDFGRRKAATAALLLAPHVPMLFMGEEYAETKPFPYFVSHGDPDLVEAVRVGRREEFADFAWEDVPDPQAEATFEAAVLDWDRREVGEHAGVLALHRELLRLRREAPLGFDRGERPSARAHGALLEAAYAGGQALLLANLGDEPVTVTLSRPWTVVLDTDEARFGGGIADLGPDGAEVDGPLAVPGGRALVAFAASP